MVTEEISGVLWRLYVEEKPNVYVRADSSVSLEYLASILEGHCHGEGPPVPGLPRSIITAEDRGERFVLHVPARAER